MSQVDLYVSRHEIFDDGRLCGTLVDCDFGPIPALRLVDQWGSLTHHILGCSSPTMTLELDDRRWTVTRDHGVINLHVADVRVQCSGIERDFVPPILLLAFARHGHHGVKLIAGKDPFTPDVTEAQVVTQRDLEFAKGF